MARADFEMLLSKMGYVPPREDRELHAWIRRLVPGSDPAAMSDDELMQMVELRMADEMRSAGADRMAVEVKRRLEAVPPAYHEISAHSFAWMPKTFTRLMAGMSALVIGPNGCGKTALSWALYRESVIQGEWPVVVANAMDILHSLKGTVYQRGLCPRDAVKERWGRGVRRLLIDELDKIRGTEDDFLLLFELIDFRYSWRLQTVAFANGSLEDVRNRIGQSAYARLTSDGAVALTMPKHDFRRRDDD